MATENFISLRDIADKAGVSVSAVSLALRNSPKTSVKRREEIQRIAQEMGYRQDPRVAELMQHLRKSRRNRTRSQMAILVPELSREETKNHPRFRELIAGIRSLAETVGFGVDLIYLSDPGMSCRLARSIIIARGIKGAVVLPFASGTAKLDFDFGGLCVATAGYSIVEPKLHRACPDYFKMMDEMLDMCVAAGHQRIGLIMTKTGGIGFKQFNSSFLYFQSGIPAADRIPMLGSPIRRTWHDEGAAPDSIKRWLHKYKPEVVIGTAQVLQTIQGFGISVPDELGFVSIDVSESPSDAAGANHCYEMVGYEAFKLMWSSLNLNLTGVPEHPRVVLVDSHQQPGFTLLPKSTKNSANPAAAKMGKRKSTPTSKVSVK
ncbi:MAG: LacI family DNA-binding transcriptional regulator [Opitutaceae bacterium]|jgi:LacI family transcriptional regulator|nr:LacI family DNA-binding transcriptional regulator [Opitutaceae bacterium]